MGLEWHNRKRSTDGRFAKREKAMTKAGAAPMAQLHIRLPSNLADRLRTMAIAEECEISQICVELIEIYVEDWEMEREKQQTNGRPAEQE